MIASDPLGAGDFVTISIRRRAQLGLAAAFVVLAASLSALILVPHYSRPVQLADVGTTAPDFELPDLSGGTIALHDAHGQIVVLFFSSLQSPQSVQYNDRVGRLARSYDNDARVKFFAINVGDADHADPFLLRLDDRISSRTYPTLLDEKGIVATRYSANQPPFMIVIDPRGIVRYRGAFDNNPDIAFATHSYLADVLHDVVESSTVAVASK
jgi:peroxiredoxin